METEKDCLDGIDACDCPDGVDDTDEEREAKFKAYGIESIPVDDETLNLQRRERWIRERNAYLATLPPETDEDIAENARIAAVWTTAMEEVSTEDHITTLAIGQWFHDEPCVAPDGRKDGLTRAFELLGVCPRIRSWRRKPPRNNLLTVIWTLSWSNQHLYTSLMTHIA